MKLENLLYIFVILLFGCKKINYYPDKLIEIEATKLIAHRGGGNSFFRDNTLEGIKAALRYKDGIEIDVQISKNETVWLSHSDLVMDCNKTLNCFAETTDKEIRAIKLCNNEDISYTELDSVFKFISDSFPDKIICIDLKAWTPCGVTSVGVDGVMKREAEVVINLAMKYKLINNVHIETETASVLEHIKSQNKDIGTFLTSFGDLERAMLISLKQNYTGISYKNNSGEILTKEKINLMHKKGLKLIVWNLKNADEIKSLTEIGVDYIQMDL